MSTENWKSLGLLLLRVAFVTPISLKISSDGKLKRKRNSALQPGLL